jgi:ApbE superfamily uncharacterized protein (UPF0280 family)
MTPRQQVGLLPDGRRLHLQDGPIDLVIGADGAEAEIRRAYEAVADAFSDVLDRLCAELDILRRPVDPAAPCGLAGPIARRMQAAVLPHAGRFVTPMAAVAGAVAEHILAALTAGGDLERAYVNNGGDIALHLGPSARFTIGMIDRPDRPNLFGKLSLTAADGIGGIATSGRHGRSFSLGIADAVTVLAARAADADAAATMIANAVDLPGHAGISRVAARLMQPDSDLGDLLVTRGVEPLGPDEIETALVAGMEEAARLVEAGLVRAAALHLMGETRIVGAVPHRLEPAMAFEGSV